MIRTIDSGRLRWISIVALAYVWGGQTARAT